MFFFTKPDESAIAEFRDRQRRLPLSYSEVLATRSHCPPGYAAAHYRVQLGWGERSYEAACDAIRSWKPFPAPLVTVHPEPDEIALGTHVVVRIQSCGIWALLCSEIVDVIDTHFGGGEGPHDVSFERFGFAYGTKPGHAERGEERFCVEWYHDDDSVWYDLRSYSRPQHWLVWAALPYARHQQRRFARYSLAAMVRAVEELKSQPGTSHARSRHPARRIAPSIPD